jgi:enoyl-CoA hydratase
MIHREDRGPVALITLDRQERRNAVDHDTLDELHEAIRASAGARVVVLTGAGGHFCSGADLKGVEDASFRDRLSVVLRDLRELPLPTIAAVAGAALGAGTQLAAACDLRVATPDARFGIPAARLGLMVDLWTVRRVAMLCGQGPASAMLLAAETISGSEALSLGLVQRLGDLEAALAWADDISALAPLTIAGHKLALDRLEAGSDRAGAGDADEEFEAAYRRAWESDDLQEGLAAFGESRRPIFRGR